MHKSPRALAIEAQPFDPALLTIAGDATTPNGARYADTFLNDYRNPDMISWSPAHEALVLSLAQTASVSGATTSSSKTGGNDDVAASSSMRGLAGSLTILCPRFSPLTSSPPTI